MIGEVLFAAISQGANVTETVPNLCNHNDFSLMLDSCNVAGFHLSPRYHFDKSCLKLDGVDKVRVLEDNAVDHGGRIGRPDDQSSDQATVPADGGPMFLFYLNNITNLRLH